MTKGQNESLKDGHNENHGHHIHKHGMFVDQRPRNDHENVDKATANETREKVAVKEAEIEDVHQEEALTHIVPVLVGLAWQESLKGTD